MKLLSQIRSNRAAQAGFSLLEVTVAVSILAVGILGGMGVICAATASNGSSKINTAAAMVAQSTMEKILATAPGAATSITDCAGTPFPMSTALVPPPADGVTPTIDFTQAATPNYSMVYVACSRLNFDVRWRIDAGPTPSTQLITVSIKSLRTDANPAAALIRKFTLRTVRGN
jgi:prepilin-type N-terminal cleavage/methylation domain-containing protein